MIYMYSICIEALHKNDLVYVKCLYRVEKNIDDFLEIQFRPTVLGYEDNGR